MMDSTGNFFWDDVFDINSYKRSVMSSSKIKYNICNYVGECQFKN